jgi:type IV pilus assembly protein PilW
VDYLQRDLRMVGHMGCVNDQSRFLPENDSGTRSALASTFLDSADLIANNYGPAYVKDYLRFDQGILGYEADGTSDGDTLTSVPDPVEAGDPAAWTPTIPATLWAELRKAAGTPGNIVENTDLVVLHYFAPNGAQMTTFAPGDPTATIGVGTDADKWERMMAGVPTAGLFGIGDCMNAAVFHASAVDPTTGTITVTKDSTINRGAMAGYESFIPGQAMVYRAETVVYYVGRNGDGNPALYRMRYEIPPGATAFPAAPATKEELVEGIETLQLRYGQDSRTAANQRPTGNIGSSGTADELQPAADQATAWRRVGLVQVGLVARSDNPSAALERDDSVNGVPLSLHGLTIAPPATNDTRFRAVYEESVALRNRLFGQ